MSIINQLESPGHAQFSIATHSPILLSYSGAKVISFDDGRMEEINYQDSSHYQLTKSFLDNPERYFRWLFEEDE
jgi:predicted ATPase